MSTASPRLAALRHRDFRLVWSGELVSSLGSSMQSVAIDWHVFQLLRGQTVTISDDFALGAEALGLGLLGLVRVIPIILFALVGGLLADTFDRRKLMIGTRLVASLLAALLAALTLTGNIQLGIIYMVTAAAAGVAAFDSPARQSLVPNLVPREHLSNAVSLNSLIGQLSGIIGPALAGLLIGVGGMLLLDAAGLAANAQIGIVYGINAFTFLAAIIALSRIRYRKTDKVDVAGVGIQPLMEGLKFTYNTRIIWGTMLLDFFATFFSSVRTMMPIVATTILGLDATGYGLLVTAQPLGAFLAGGTLALRSEIHNQGRVLLISVALYGVATALFGLSTNPILSYVLFAMTGAADTVSTVIRGTIRQIMTPDRLRGRMTSVNMIFFMGGPQLGELESGLVASIFGVPFTIVFGGVATTVLTGVIAWRYPRLRNYTRETARRHLEEQDGREAASKVA